MANQPQFTRLKTILAKSKVKETDIALYEVLSRLIDALVQSQTATTEQITTVITGDVAALQAEIDLLKALNYLTHANDSAVLTSSRRLLAGTNVTFDDTVANQRTINVSASQEDYVVMSDGATPIPSPVDDGFGNFIYVQYTP